MKNVTESEHTAVFQEDQKSALLEAINAALVDNCEHIFVIHYKHNPRWELKVKLVYDPPTTS